MTKLARTLGGIRDMAKVPSAVWIVDTNKEHLAVAEARKLKIPVVAILDTNCDPDLVDYPIPGNDDAIRSAALLTKVVATAVAEGLQARAGRSGDGDSKPEGAANEPLAEWEQELLAQSATAEAPAAEAAAQAEAPATEAPATEVPATEVPISELPAAATPSAATAVTETVEEAAGIPETAAAESAIGGAPVSDTDTPVKSADSTAINS